jgi:hypothetical protein
MAPEVNETIIVLIPKINDPVSLKYFRSISLCNVTYKIMTKCIANRLLPLLDGLIRECESAFIPGRLVAFEYFHNIQRNKKKGSTFYAYILYLTKAYERVDWNYLK